MQSSTPFGPQLTLTDSSGQPVAYFFYYFRPSLITRQSRLEILPAGEYIADIIVATAVCVRYRMPRMAMILMLCGVFVIINVILLTYRLCKGGGEI